MYVCLYVYLYVCLYVYLYVCLYVCLYVFMSGLGENVIFSAPNWDIARIFFLQIPLINEHLFCKYIVRLYAQ